MSAHVELDRITKYGWTSWQDSEMDELRRGRCLCLRCANLLPGLSNCPSAEVLFALCKTRGMAMMITRCADYRGKQKGGKA